MENLNEIFTWQNFFTGAGFIFGIITLIAYLDQRKTNKENNALLEFAKKESNKKLIEELESTKENLVHEVTNKIPGLGKVAILEEQANFYTKIINENYNELEKTKKLLESSGIIPSNELSPDIRNYILNHLSPKYKKDKLIDNIRDKIIVIFALIIAMDAFLPFGTSFLIKFFLGILLIIEIVKYYVTQTDSVQEMESRYSNVKFFVIIVGLFAITLCTLYLVNEWNFSWKNFKLDHFLFTVIGLAGLVLIICSTVLINSLKQKINSQIYGSA